MNTQKNEDRRGIERWSKIQDALQMQREGLETAAVLYVINGGDSVKNRKLYNSFLKERQNAL